MRRIAGIVVLTAFAYTAALAGAGTDAVTDSVTEEQPNTSAMIQLSAVPFRAPASSVLQSSSLTARLQAPGDPADPTVKTETKGTEEVNAPAIVIRSIILPGWGQRRLGNHVRGAFFTAMDASLWTGIVLSYIGYVDGTAAYEDYAAQHAGVIGEPGHEFYVNIGNYDTREDFNEVRRQRRDYANQYTGSGTYWDWDSEQSRIKFEDQRISADRHRNRIYYFVGGLLLNRVAAAIDAGRTATKRNAGAIQAGYDPDTGGPTLVWTGWVW
ncbi:hypothetical protein GF324_00485 [bacterium]|nr:hypothetical protein [bacterium]